MVKNKNGSITLSTVDISVLELIVSEWEEEAEDNLRANGEMTTVQNAFIIEFCRTKMTS